MLASLFGGGLIIFWFLFSYALSYQGIDELIRAIFGAEFNHSFISFLIFLPHGVRVIAVYFGGWRAVPPLFIAHLLLYQLFSGMPPQNTHVVLALLGSLCPYIAFEAMRIANINAYYRLDQPGLRRNQFGPPLLAGILAAILNAMGSLAFFLFFGPEPRGLSFYVGYLLGDIFGLMIILSILFTISGATDMIFKSKKDGD